MNAHRTAFAATLLSLSLAALPALGDVIPPDVDACRGRAVGAACGGAVGVSSGTCRNAICTRLDYASWDRDASPTPPTMQYACIRCESGGDGGAPTPTTEDSGCSASPGASSGGAAVFAALGLAWALVRVRRSRRG